MPTTLPDNIYVRTDKDGLLRAGAVTLKRHHLGSFFLCVQIHWVKEGREWRETTRCSHTYLAHGPGHFNVASGHFAQHVAEDLACL